MTVDFDFEGQLRTFYHVVVLQPVLDEGIPCWKLVFKCPDDEWFPNQYLPRSLYVLDSVFQ